MRCTLLLFVTACHTAAPAQRPVAVKPGTPAADQLEFHLGELRQLTFGGENAEAYWSNDGTELILQSTHPPYACDQIFRVKVDASAPELTLVSPGTGRATCSYFFPGDHDVLYSSTHGAAPACPPKPDFTRGYVWALYDAYEIYRARLQGGVPENISHSPGYDAEATVCARDGSIVFTSTRDGDIELYRMDSDGRNVRRLTHAPGYDGGAYFSPDCRRIVWRASRPKPGAELEDFQRLLAEGLVRPTKLELWTANADGTEARQITYLDAASFAPSWFPSGDRVIFASNYGDPKGREFDLWAVNADGTRLERVTRTPGFDGFPMFSPDGSRLAFASNRNGRVQGETNVFVARWREAGLALDKRGPDRFLADVAWLADDLREGRGLGTQGLEDSARWLEVRFAQLGLEPAGDGGKFRHAFEVPTTVVVRAARLELDGAAAPGVVAAGFSTSGDTAGQVVAAGYGISAPELGHDDYKHRDVKGKIVLLRRFAPDRGRWEPNEQRHYSDPRYKTWNAREHGAVGVIFADLDDATEKPLPRPEVALLGDAGLTVLFAPRAAVRRLAAGRHRARLHVQLEVQRQPTYNIVGRLRGGAAGATETVVMGAHYDHLGMGGSSSLAPDVVAPHNGADDNASGVAGLLEAARLLGERKKELGHDVLFVAFSGEEAGVRGSTAFTTRPPPGVVIKSVAAMINMDMVGRLRDNRLQILGADTAGEWRDLVGAACATARIDCAFGEGGGYGPSDQTPFYAAGVPVVHLFTGAHREYHRPTDDTALINAAGGAQVASLAADLALRVAARPARLSFRAAPAPLPAGDLRAGGASLGTVPDYVGPPEGTPGVLLAGVRPGGPADAAGLRRGDILVEIDRHAIRSVEDFMFVLAASTPGNKGRVTVLRDGKRVELEVTFGPPMRR